jgi:hypothetical protein
VREEKLSKNWLQIRVFRFNMNTNGVSYDNEDERIFKMEVIPDTRNFELGEEKTILKFGKKKKWPTWGNIIFKWITYWLGARIERTSH